MVLPACCRGISVALEDEMEGHLYLAWAADGVGGDAQTGCAVIEAGVCVRARGWQYRCSDDRGLIVILVLIDLVARDVKTGGVAQVEDVEGVFEVIALSKFGRFDKGYVGASLRTLAEYVPLAFREVRFIGVGVGVIGAIRNCAP